MMRSRVIAIVAVGLATATAPSGVLANPELKEARRLLDDLFVKKAGKKFRQALERGNSDAETTAQIFLGLGEVSATEGNPDDAFEYFKQALAIDTLLDLPPGTSPKVAEPLQKARALFRKGAKRLALAVNIDTSNGVRASAKVLSDPFKMVSGISVELLPKDEDEEGETKTINTSSDLIPIPLTQDVHTIVVSLIDEHGNKLATNEAVELPAGKRVGEGGDGDGDGGDGDGDGGGGGGGSIATNWIVWAGLATVIGATGAGFGIWTRSIVSDIEDMAADSQNVEFSDVKALQKKAEKRALIANISFGVAGACAIAATVFFFTGGDGESSERQTVLVPVIGPDHIGVSAALSF